jgi:pimeloyl-ACP methyl ester carboxylesterase
MSGPVDLAVRELGESGPPVLIMHGLLGAGRNWQAIGKQLARHRRVVLIDLRNHGHSPWSAEMTYPAMVDDLAAVLDRLGIASADIVGHSMGGKAAMALALLRPRLASRLVAVDIAPVAYGGTTFEHYLRDLRALDLPALGRRTAVDAALAASVPEPAIRAFLLQNLAVAPEGLSWQANLDVLAATLPEITGFPSDLTSRRYDGPSLFIRGELSNYVGDSGWAAARRLFPRAELVTVPGVGHWVQAEAPGIVLQAIEGFLDR